MKKTLIACLFLTGSMGAAWGQQTPACPTLLNHTFPRLQDEKPQSLCQYSGKVLLIVNTASYCGFTPQYKGLEELHARYKDRGLVVLGFPSNDFQQEYADDGEIKSFCSTTFGVTFPLFSRSSVIGPSANPVFAALAGEPDEVGAPPEWNFTKYLLDRDGLPVARWPSNMDPAAPTVTNTIEALLAQPA